MKQAVEFTDAAELLNEYARRLIENLRREIQAGARYACPHCGDKLTVSTLTGLILLEPNGIGICGIGCHDACKDNIRQEQTRAVH